jgi:hypothetical protein
MTAFMHERHACEPAGEIAPDGLPSALPAERALTCRHGRHELDEVRLPRARHEPDRRQGVPGRNRVDDDLTEVRLPGWRNDREIVRIDLIGNDESRPAILSCRKDTERQTRFFPFVVPMSSRLAGASIKRTPRISGVWLRVKLRSISRNGGCGNSGSPRTDGCFNDQTTKTTQLKIGPAGHWSLGHWVIETSTLHNAQQPFHNSQRDYPTNRVNSDTFLTRSKA